MAALRLIGLVALAIALVGMLDGPSRVVAQDEGTTMNSTEQNTTQSSGVGQGKIILVHAMFMFTGTFRCEGFISGLHLKFRPER